MKKRIYRYFKHLLGTVGVLLLAGIAVLLFLNGSVSYAENPQMRNLNQEGPYVFFENDSVLSVNIIQGNKSDGFSLNRQRVHIDSAHTSSAHFQLDSSSFDFALHPKFEVPPSTYQDDEPVLAISDIEGGYKAFRDFLIANQVMDKQLNWAFGKGHLVLVGDFVDRGWSVTQVLWLIYKLEQEAADQGGRVHFILGNHELKNMQSNFMSAAPKYLFVSGILEKPQSALYGPSSFLGKWMASKNSIERINGTLFVHGGLHPDLTAHKLSLDQLNQAVRKNCYKPYYPKADNDLDQLILSTQKGICWYRGYFKGVLSQEQVENGLHQFEAQAVVVGHTVQRRVRSMYEGKVFAIDVKHPKDYRKSWPSKDSEGLLISGGKYHRLFSDGTREELD